VSFPVVLKIEPEFVPMSLDRRKEYPMSRLLCGTFAALALLGVSSPVSLPPTFAAEQGKKDKEVKVLVDAAWLYAPRGKKATGVRVAIRNMGELHMATGIPSDSKGRNQMEMILAQPFPGVTVDFDKHMILLVTGGAPPTDGYRVQVTKVALDKEHKTMTVHWRLHTPKKGDTVTEVVTHPGRLVLLKRFDGEVKFEPLSQPKHKFDEPKK
jgi:hypothetical protein